MYLVTGGAGFIGSHIAKKLVSMGKRVRVLDNFSSGKRENLDGLEGAVELLSGDLLDQEALARAARGVEVIFHQAAIRSVPYSIENPSLTNRVNVEGTLNVLLAARDAGVRRVVYASSSSVYGDAAVLAKKEEQKPEPLSPYAVSKLVGEYYCKIFTELYGLETVSLRYFNVYGPGQDPESQYAAVIPRFICGALQGQALEVHGDGLQSRDFTYIDNVVAANLLAAGGDMASGGIFNVGQGGSHSLMDLIELLRGILGTEVRWVHSPARAGDVRRSLADISQANRCLGYRPGISFAEGIARTVQFFSRGLVAAPGWNVAAEL